MPPQLDIIIPVYNEADNVQPLAERINTALKKAKIKYHMYFVDDHSTDTTVSTLKRLAKKFPLTTLTKKGQRGKAFSILEAAQVATAPYLVMIDADLQYPPEVIPDMFQLVQMYGVVVAKRNTYNENAFRKVMSKTFQWFFGKVLHGLECDVQSGLKIFKREIITHVSAQDITPWTLDIPLLTTALNLGFTIGEVSITFNKRNKGESKIKVFSSIREIGGHALTYKFKSKKYFQVFPDNKENMIGAGIIKRGKRFITHTTLQSSESALDVVTTPQKWVVFSILGGSVAFLLTYPLLAAQVIVGALSTIYFLDVFFNLYVISRSLYQPPELSIKPAELAVLKDKDLPTYTVLCPLYKEAHVIPQFLEAIEQIDWPKKKLDVILLLEADDTESVEKVKLMKLPAYVSVKVVPDSQPKTKPKACNYGLSFAKGELLVIYDAEDKPDPLQLKKVYCAFQKVGSNVKCIQAKLNFYNPHQNLLTRFFTAEYSLWFDVMLTGLQSIQTTIPLGGTSNHFRTQELKDLQGWDPFNVTEDADLGIRLFKRGALTAIIDSVTLEEANSHWGNWIRQRSRWIKGYMQTYLVHMRSPYRFFRENGFHALLFQLILGGKIAFMLINPLMWILTLTYFGLYAWAGPTIESLYPSNVFYMAVTSLVFGNFMFLYYYMIGAAKREHWTIIKWTLLIPVYWVMVSWAAAIAFYQLIVKPHYWEKTVHGLHLKNEAIKKEAKKGARFIMLGAITSSLLNRIPHAISGVPFTWFPVTTVSGFKNQFQRLSFKALTNKLKNRSYQSGLILIGATMLSNVINMLTNIYSGHELNLAQFATLNTYVSLLYIANIPAGAFSSMLNYHVSYLYGKNKIDELNHSVSTLRRHVWNISLGIAIVWIALTPYLARFFQTLDRTAIVLFALVWLATFTNSLERGYLRGRLLFAVVAIPILVDPIARLVFTVLFSEVFEQWSHMVYLSIPLTLIGVLIVSQFLSRKYQEKSVSTEPIRLPWKFFTVALISGLSTIAYFTLDTIMVSAYLPVTEAGKYGILGLIGKMIYFAGGLVLTFITPIISYYEGKGEKTNKQFTFIWLATFATAFGSYLALGVGITFFSSLFGEKINAIKDLLPLYGLGIASFTLAQMYVSYYLAKKVFAFPIAAFLLALVQLLGLRFFHANLQMVVLVMTVSGLLNLTCMHLMHMYLRYLRVPFHNFNDFLDLFTATGKLLPEQKTKSALRVLIFNWRDSQHVWAGGAEVYVEELAKQLVAKGHQVTIFCGNDGKSARNDIVNGVKIIRRGGFFMVYFWAVVYYLLKLRGKYDVIIDSENGVPFLTPLFTRIPVILLIHHVHQNVFREHLSFPLKEIALFLESKAMPALYRNNVIVTVSKSSKEDIIRLANWAHAPMVVPPGVSLPKNLHIAPDTVHPSICYVGRLMPYKNLETAIVAFADVLKKIPDAHFNIAGDGESKRHLQRLVEKLKIEKNVSFLGKVSHEEKVKLLSSSWAMVQPSMIEGWGITVIEANTCGTPVIASNVKGLRDSIKNGETGLLVSPKNVTAFAEAIEKVLTQKTLRKKLSQRSLKWAAQFNWDHTAAGFIEIFHRQFQLERAEKVTESTIYTF